MRDSPQNLLKITNDVFMLKQYNDEPKVTVELYKNRAVFNDKAIYEYIIVKKGTEAEQLITHTRSLSLQATSSPLFS